MAIKAVRGVRDILPAETGRWQRVEAAGRATFEAYGYREIRLPLFERTELFARGIGDETDIVKEGLLAIVFKGPAGFRLQSIDTGFEGTITALGGFKTDDANQPTIIATVVRYKNILKTAAETQIIMTVPQE